MRPLTKLPVVAPATAALVFVLAVAEVCAAETTGPRGPESGDLRRQAWLIPSPDRATLMRATLFRPPGPGPFRLAVINHGSTQGATQRAKFPAPLFRGATEWLVRQGFAVLLPQRPGHGETGGRYLEDQRGCENADYRGAGLAAADSIQMAVDFMRTQAFVQKTGAVVIGHSAGGWGALALASRNPKGVSAVIAFAAGRGGRIDNRPGQNCAPDRLVEAARSYGAHARVPVLAIYAQNDSFFRPTLAKRVIDAFRRSGGRAEYQILPAFEEDGHYLFERASGVAAWSPLVEAFLNRHR